LRAKIRKLWVISKEISGYHEILTQHEYRQAYINGANIYSQFLRREVLLLGTILTSGFFLKQVVPTEKQKRPAKLMITIIG